MGWQGPMTHRQFFIWQVHLANQWNRPDRHDHYQMRTALEIRRCAMAKKGGKAPGMEDYRLEFIPKKMETPQEKADKEAKKIAASKAAWAGFLGAKVRHITISKDSLDTPK